MADGITVDSASATGDSDTTVKSGTSMAAPAVTGAAALLLERYRSLFTSASDPLASTIKAVLMHTAFDIGKEGPTTIGVVNASGVPVAGAIPVGRGPEYSVGYGLVDARAASDFLGAVDTAIPGRAHFITECSRVDDPMLAIDPADEEIEIDVAAGATFLKATMVWTDPPGAALGPAGGLPPGPPPTTLVPDPSARALVNDLDLRIRRESDGVIFFPWVLNRAAPAALATTGDNNVDNVEQVFIATPTPGRYTILVTHKGPLTPAPGTTRPVQRYSLLAETDSGSVVRADDFRVHTATTNQQRLPDVAMDDDGNFVVVWQSNDGRAGTDGYEIYFQRYNAAGVAQGPEARVNTITAGDQVFARVAMDDAGEFVVTWTDYGGQDGSAHGIFYRRFNATGSPKDGADRQANTGVLNIQRRANIAMDKDSLAADPAGQFVIVWESDLVGDAANYDLYHRRFSKSTGSPIDGADVLTNTLTTSWQHIPAIAVDRQGDYVIAWTNYYEYPLITPGDVRARRFNASGTAQPMFDEATQAFVTTDARVNDFTPGNQISWDPGVAMDDDGDFVIAWWSRNQPPDSSSYGVFARRYTLAGAHAAIDGVSASERLINTFTTGRQMIPAVDMDGQGNFIVVWGAYAQDGDASNQVNIYAQRFAAAGTRVGGEFRANSFTTGDQFIPDVAMDADGDYVVVWHDYARDSGTFGIYGQRFCNVLSPVDPAPPLAFVLTASLGQSTAPPVGETLTPEALAPIVEAAIGYWAAAGLDPAIVETLRSVQFVIADLPEGVLGATVAGTIFIDIDAAGYGWFIDTTPGDSAEFDLATLLAISGSEADGRFDLLTVVLHELGHFLGLPGDADGSPSLMTETLDIGARRLPTAEEVDLLFSSPPADDSGGFDARRMRRLGSSELPPPEETAAQEQPPADPDEMLAAGSAPADGESNAATPVTAGAPRPLAEPAETGASPAGLAAPTDAAPAVSAAPTPGSPAPDSADLVDSAFSEPPEAWLAPRAATPVAASAVGAAITGMLAFQRQAPPRAAPESASVARMVGWRRAQRDGG